MRYCLVSFDIEEWFQVENLKDVITRKDWELKQSSVIKNTRKILKILNDHQISSTFFILGWIAQKYPALINEIIDSGHEIACHGYGHYLNYRLPDDELLYDISRSKDILEENINQPVTGYRAPSFSVDDRVLTYLKKLGFLYDSSLNPFKLNKRYGTVAVSLDHIVNGCFKTKDGLYEIPISTINFWSLNIPFGGGAYFRVIPLWLFKNLVKRKLDTNGLYNFYLHPWEFEPEQERIRNIKLNYQFRHYYGLDKTAEKFEKLILYLKSIDCNFLTMAQFVAHMNNSE